MRDIYTHQMSQYNETAYNNEDLFLQWMKDELPVVQGESRDFLLVMDVASFHKTNNVKALLREMNITPAPIPPGLTSMLQSLDTAINRPFKDWLREETELYIEEREKRGLTEWTVSEKRIMTTWVVARAMERLRNRPDLVEKAFIDCGITVRPDGTQDRLISFEDIDEVDFTGWEDAEEPYVKSEEIVDRICDGEEFVLSGDEGNSLEIGLMMSKKEDLKEMARDLGISVTGNKRDIVERLVDKYTQGTTEETAITVEEEPNLDEIMVA
ncbi:hypothetical protein ACJZ2D_016337 [Fusarium nematophilum]